MGDDVRHSVPLYGDAKPWETHGKLIGHVSLQSGRVMTPNGNRSQEIRGDSRGGFFPNKAHAARVEAAVAYANFLGVSEVLQQGSLTEEGVREWMNSGNKVLDGAKPADCLVDDLDKVMEAAEGFVEGSYV